MTMNFPTITRFLLALIPMILPSRMLLMAFIVMKMEILRPLLMLIL